MAEQRLILTLGLIGGTGKEGKGLAYRWARAGYNVIIGSRTKEKAEAAAQELNARLGGDHVRGMLNSDGAGAAAESLGRPRACARQRRARSSGSPRRSGARRLCVSECFPRTPGGGPSDCLRCPGQRR